MLLKTASDFGNLILNTRMASNLTQRELAAACGVGVRFIQDLEKGKPTCELEKSLLVASMLGIKLETNLPRSIKASKD